jgi:hypothetical protein
VSPQSDPPAATKKELTALRRQLSRELPKKTDRNLLIATWNIREFGGLTEKWRSTSKDTPKRDLHWVGHSWIERPEGMRCTRVAQSVAQKESGAPSGTPLSAYLCDGEGQNRTGDTTIFSRVLYQLSYLAERR